MGGRDEVMSAVFWRCGSSRYRNRNRRQGAETSLFNFAISAGYPSACRKTAQAEDPVAIGPRFEGISATPASFRWSGEIIVGATASIDVRSTFPIAGSR